MTVTPKDPLAFTQAEYNSTVPTKRDPQYGQGFFRNNEGDHLWSTFCFGHVVHLLLEPKSAIEFGCGTAGTLAVLKREGATVQAVDYSEACVPFIGRHDREIAEGFMKHDFGTPWTDDRKFDVAITIECLEHIMPEGADNAVDTLCKVAPLVLMTACPPVGRNPLHFNEQPPAYWAEKFEARGFEKDQALEGVIRTIMREFDKPKTCPLIPAWYFSSYFQVFRKKETA
jgi:hypothetical protein